MLYDVHVHAAQLGSHEATDRFLHRRPNLYVRMFLRQLGIPADALADPQINVSIRQRLLDWVAHCSINRFVLLAMDGVYARHGQPAPDQTRWVVANDFVASLAEAHPSLLFGASVHPYRTDALDELQRVIGRGACLVKWICSAQRIRLDDARCTPFYEMLAQHGVPLLVHTGNEHTSSGGSNSWNDPALLRHPLSRGVKVIAAHCGARLFLHERCYSQSFCRLALEHEHLYGDLAAFGICTRIAALRRMQKNPDLMAKIVYGSDFPAVPMARTFVLSIGRQAVREIIHEANPLQRPYLLMRKMEVPDEVFSRAGKLLRLRAAPGGRA
jgi:predicted TIM-barrel fold metal-dependent hydrolase